MPRKSASSGDIVALPIRRDPPSPPPDLTQEQAEQWRAIVGALPVDYFDTEALPVLRELVRAISNSSEFSRWLDRTPLSELHTEADLRQHARVSRLYLAAANQVARLSGKLRFLPANRYSPNHAPSRAGQTGYRVAADRPRPWERKFLEPDAPDDDGAA